MGLEVHSGLQKPGESPSRFVVGIRVDGTSYRDVVERVLGWAVNGESRYVCVANVHVVMEARDREDVREAVNGADLVTPDGMPLVWLLRHRDLAGQTRVYGPNLTVQLCEAAAGSGVPVGFYGGRPDAVGRLIERLTTDFPDLRVAYAASPPFRELSLDEDEQVTAAINASKAKVLFVGLGCPKQERWMAAHRGRIRSVMLGVGAAFDFVSGMKAQAPIWMQSTGLEWLFRLATEPRRLCRRYVIGNTRFLFHVALEECRSAAEDWSRRTESTEGRSTENH